MAGSILIRAYLEFYVKKVLLTGCPGRLGNAVLDALLKKGYDVRLVMKPGLDASKLPKKASKRLFLDLAEEGEAPAKLLKQFVKGTDFVIHIYGQVDYLAPRKKLFRENFEATLNLIQACLKAGGVKKFVYTSSTSVFRRPHKLPITEGHPPTPTNYYGESKLAAEEVVKASGLPFIILRPTVMVGAEYVSNFKKFISMAANGRATIVGDGKNRISWVAVDDVVRAYLLAIEKPVANEDFIIASDKPVRQDEAIKLLCKELAVPFAPKHVNAHFAYAVAKAGGLFHKLTGRKPPLVVEEVETIAHDRYYDVSKAKRLLGWTPKTTFQKAAHEMVAEWKAHNK